MPLHSKSTLLLGGTRSGKSRYGEKLASGTGLRPIYIATAEAHDDEMRDRIGRHQQDRADQNWRTVEEPLELAEAISANATKDAVILVDCITLWLSNIMAAEKTVTAEADKLLTSVDQAPCPVILVSNEVGMGIVPMNALARKFRDEAGWLNQKLAAVFPNCYFMVSGLPLPLKQEDKLLVESLV